MVEAQLLQYALVLQALHEKWTPHPGQIPVVVSLFRDNVKRLFLQCGRRVGKTEIATYAAIRWALTHPNAAVYIVGPVKKQMREVLWESNRIQHMAPKQFVESVNNTEMRIRFTNGSFVNVDGSDNEDSLRGLRMNFLVIDEYKDVSATLFDTLSPSLADYDAPCMLVGTPPELEGHYTAHAHEAQTDTTGFWRYFKMPTSANPHIKPEIIAREKARLEARGDADVFIREWLAEYVPGGKRAIFPFLTDDVFQPYEAMRNEVYKNITRWGFHAALDPGTASVFAGLVAAANVYEGKVYLFDELYANQQAATSTGKVWPVLQTKMKELYHPDHPSDEPWQVVSDEAATWFRNELLDQFDVPSNPTHKSLNRKAAGLSLIKDLLLSGRLVISERCTNLLREMKAYALNDQGLIPKGNDHLIDSLRYLLAAANFTYQESAPPPVRTDTPPDENKPFYTPQDDMEAEGFQNDPYWSDLLS